MLAGPDLARCLAPLQAVVECTLVSMNKYYHMLHCNIEVLLLSGLSEQALLAAADTQPQLLQLLSAVSVSVIRSHRSYYSSVVISQLEMLWQERGALNFSAICSSISAVKRPVLRKLREATLLSSSSRW